MKRLGLFVIALCLVLTPMAKADSITYQSHTGNDYTYGLTLDDHLTLFIPGGFTLTGLSGVTSASVSDDLADIFQIVSFNSTSVLVGTLFGASYKTHVPYTLGTLTITSTADPGSVQFDIYEGTFLDPSHYAGHVSGPSVDVAPTPEPSSLLLMATGLLGAAGVAKRKLRSAV